MATDDWQPIETAPSGVEILLAWTTGDTWRPYRPSRPEAAILVILENTSGTGWLLLTIAHARNDVPLR